MRIALVAMSATIILLITAVVYGMIATTIAPVMCSNPSLPSGDMAKIFIPQDNRFHVFVCNSDGAWQALN